MERGARGRLRIAQNTSERVGRRPLDLRRQLLASFGACSPSRDRSSWRYRSPTGEEVKEGEVKLLSVEATKVGWKRIV